MAVVLAIEPDPRQAAILKRVVRERARAEICVVDTKDAAIAAMGTHPPELILLTALLSPRDEEELVAHLRTLEGADHLQTLSIPLLSSASAHDEEGGFLRKAFKGKKKRGQNTVGCDPWTFAEEVAGYLKAAEEAKADREWKAARQTGPPQPADGPAKPSPATHPETHKAPGIGEFDIAAPEPPPLSDAAAFTAAQEAPAPDTSAEPPVYEWPTLEPVSDTRHPEPVVRAAPEPIVEAVPEPIFEEVREPVIELAAEPIVEAAPVEPIVEPALEPIVEAGPEQVFLAPSPEPEPELVAVADEPQEAYPAIEPEPAPEPLYLTSPDRVFEEVAAATEPDDLHTVEPSEPVEVVEPVTYRPLKRLPPLATWARVEEPASIQAASRVELSPESDTAGVLGRLRVPPHALPVSYPRRPHIRYVRAA